MEIAEPRELGILFTAKNREKVREGLKSQTRRVITVPWAKGKRVAPYEPYYVETDGKLFFMDEYGEYHPMEVKARYQVGDHLYIKEPYQITGEEFIFDKGKFFKGIYLDTNERFHVSISVDEWKKFKERKKPYDPTSSLFMYKSLSRYWFLVLRNWVERCKDISLEDIRAEGLSFPANCDGSIMRAGWKQLWNGINATPKPVKKNGAITHYASYPYDDTGKYAQMKTYQDKPHLCYPNPWTFGYEFKIIEK